jgi:putative solute:sodium symporter small subunit
MLAMLTAYRSDYWPRLKNLVLVLFGAWITLFFLTNAFMKPLNKIVVPGFELPLGQYMPMQAAVILFAVMGSGSRGRSVDAQSPSAPLTSAADADGLAARWPKNQMPAFG